MPRDWDVEPGCVHDECLELVPGGDLDPGELSLDAGELQRAKRGGAKPFFKVTDELRKVVNSVGLPRTLREGHLVHEQLHPLRDRQAGIHPRLRRCRRDCQEGTYCHHRVDDDGGHCKKTKTILGKCLANHKGKIIFKVFDQ